MAETIGTYLLEAAWAAESATAIDIATTIISWSAVINTAAVISFSMYQQARAKRAARDAYNGSLRDRLVMSSVTDGVRSRVYGRVRNVDGVVFKMSHGTNKEFYTFVISLAGHEVDAIETVYLNDVPVTLDGSGYVQEEPWFVGGEISASEPMTVTGGSGSITLSHTPLHGVYMTITDTLSGGNRTLTATPTVAGTSVSVSGLSRDGVWQVVYQYANSASMVRIRKYLGGPSQNLYGDLSALVGSAVNASDKFANDACLLVTFQYSVDAFPSGVPAVSAVMRGAKCYDPRSGTTTWTENPAIIARDWSLYANGGNCQASELVDATFTAAANACDVSTVFTTATGTETRPLYTCGIVCKLDADPLQMLDQIVSTMAGQRCWTGGKLAVRAGVWRAPAVTITEDWVTDVQAIELVGQTATADLVNIMRPSFADSANNYVVGPAAPVRYTAAIAADGRELPLEFDLQGTTHAVHAQHVAGVQMREAREGLTLTLPLNMRGWQLEVFDMVTVTLPEFGFSAKAFEVMGTSFNLATGPVVTLRERASAIYDPDASFAVLDIAANTNLPDPSYVPQVTGVTVTSNTSDVIDTSILVRTTVSWNAVASQAVQQSGAIEVQYWDASQALPAGDWLVAPPVQGNATSTVITGLRRGVHYVFRVRARNSIGVRGPWSAHVRALQAEVPQVNTPGIVPGATYAITEDTFNFGSSGTGYGTATVRTVALNPVFSCTVEISATIVAANLYGDAGHYGWWALWDGATETIVADFPSASTAKQPFAAVGKFAVTGGVSYELRLKSQRPFGDPANTFYSGYMRATELKA